MGKHTPGPWHVAETEVHARIGAADERTVFLSIEAAGYVAGGGIALVHQKTSAANALLIAAAPEMKDKLRLTADALREAANILRGKGLPSFADNILMPLVDDAFAVLAKIEPQ